MEKETNNKNPVKYFGKKAISLKDYKIEDKNRYEYYTIPLRPLIFFEKNLKESS